MKQLWWINSLFICLFMVQSAAAQNSGDKGKKITIRNADQGIYQKGLGRNRLLGNVVFEHEGALMYCDSAWLYSQQNKIRAFEKVHINQGDTLFLWGDYLEYNGNTKQALVTGEEVKLKDDQMTLITDRLDFNRRSGVAYYQQGGEISNEENLLTSLRGYYHTETKFFHFKDSVTLINPRYRIDCDTLIYSSVSRLAFFEGPTTITSDSSYIYCENGRYNTIDDIAQFNRNALLYDQNKYLTGDSLYYEKANEYGEAYRNVFIHDTIENYVITGDYAEYLGKQDSTMVTLDPIYSVVQDSDTMHIHGDTLSAYSVKDSLGEYKQIKVFRGVKIFKSDLQGKCDSLSYNDRDSAFKMYTNPIIWSDSSQVSGDTIFLELRHGKLDSLKIYSRGFILSENDLGKYDQIKGRKIFGKFIENDLRRVFVSGNGQTIYFPKDDKDEFIGMNRAICSNILIKLKDNEVQAITFLNKPEAKLHPLSEAQGELTELEGLLPRFNERPISKSDLLR